MDKNKIEQIRSARENGKTHGWIIAEFELFHAQEYAINCLGRDNGLTPGYMALHIHKIKDGMTTGQIAQAMGFPPEITLRR